MSQNCPGPASCRWPGTAVAAGPGHSRQAEQSGEGPGRGDLVPRVVGLVQRGRHGADGRPEMPVRGLEQARPPGGYRQRAAGPDQAPHLRGERRHIPREEHAEDAYHGVETAVRQPGGRSRRRAGIRCWPGPGRRLGPWPWPAAGRPHRRRARAQPRRRPWPRAAPTRRRRSTGRAPGHREPVAAATPSPRRTGPRSSRPAGRSGPPRPRTSPRHAARSHRPAPARGWARSRGGTVAGRPGAGRQSTPGRIRRSPGGPRYWSPPAVRSGA